MRHLYTRNTPEQAKRELVKALWESDEVKSLRESIKSRTGLDIKDEKAFPVNSPDFSMKKFREKAMKESVTASMFPQLLRAGIQAAVNSAYQTVEVAHDKWTHTIASDKATELYAPLHGLSFPGQVGAGEKYPESSALGLDIKLTNYKFGQIFPVQKELLEDDQTGQMQQLVSLMAEYAKQVIEVWCYGKMASVAGMSYAGLSVPVSETKPSTEANYPYTAPAAPFVGGGYNRPAAFGALTQVNIQNGMIALKNQLNLLGLKMAVNPKVLSISPHYEFDARVLMHSTNTPVGASAAGVVGGAFAINPIQSILEVVVSRFMFDQNGSVNADSKAWQIMDNTKPFFVSQLRTPAAVTQENPEAGASFDQDVTRWKLSLRQNADFIDPRFLWLGSDGSV